MEKELKHQMKRNNIRKVNDGIEIDDIVLKSITNTIKVDGNKNMIIQGVTANDINITISEFPLALFEQNLELFKEMKFKLTQMNEDINKLSKESESNEPITSIINHLYIGQIDKVFNYIENYKITDVFLYNRLKNEYLGGGLTGLQLSDWTERMTIFIKSIKQ